MRPVNMHEAKTHLSRLVQRAASGEVIVIARGGKPVAKLVAYDFDPAPRVPGSLRGLIHVADTFDDPLPPEIVERFFDPA